MTLTYKGYTAGPISLDPEDGALSGIVLDLTDVIYFEGADAAELRPSFEGSIDDYLSLCADHDEAAERARKLSCLFTLVR